MRKPASSQLKGEIEALEAAIEPMLRELDSHVEEFGAEIPTAVEEWMQHHIRRKIEDKSQISGASGLGDLKPAKSAFKDLVDSVPAICRTSIGKPETWPHRDNSLVNAQYGHEKVVSDFLHEVFRSAINVLGPVLKDHGLLGTPSGHAREWEHTTNGQMRYAYNTGFDSKEFSSADRYRQGCTTYVEQAKQLNSKQADLERALATEQWDNA